MRKVNFHSPSSVPSPLDIKSSSNLSEVKLEQEVSALRIENYELHSKLGLERGQLSRERDEQIYKTNNLVRLLSELKTEVDGLLCRCGREEHIVDIGTDSTYIGICDYLMSALVFMQEELREKEAYAEELKLKLVDAKANLEEEHRSAASIQKALEEKENTIGSLTQLTEELRNQLNRQKSTYEAIIKEKGEAEVASHEALVDCEDRLNKMAARKTELEGRVDDLEGKLHEFSFAWHWSRNWQVFRNPMPILR